MRDWVCCVKDFRVKRMVSRIVLSSGRTTLRAQKGAITWRRRSRLVQVGHCWLCLSMVVATKVLDQLCRESMLMWSPNAKSKSELAMLTTTDLLGQLRRALTLLEQRFPLNGRPIYRTLDSSFQVKEHKRLTLTHNQAFFLRARLLKERDTDCSIDRVATLHAHCRTRDRLSQWEDSSCLVS